MASLQRTIIRKAKFAKMNKQRRILWAAEHGTKHNNAVQERAVKIRKGGAQRLATMYELTAYYRTVLEMASDPEIDPQAIADTLEGIGGEIEIKAENTAKVLKELEAEAAKLKEDLKAGVVRKYAHLEQGESLRIK